MKKVLILNGSFCEVPIIKKAKELGYYVVTTGNMPNLVDSQERLLPFSQNLAL